MLAGGQHFGIVATNKISERQHDPCEDDEIDENLFFL